MTVVDWYPQDQRHSTGSQLHTHCGGSCCKHDDLWKGRRLKLKLHKDVPWRYATVTSLEEYVPRIRDVPIASWRINISFTDIPERQLKDNKDDDDDDDDDNDDDDYFRLGDVVRIIGGPKKHRNQLGDIVKIARDPHNGERYYIVEYVFLPCISRRPRRYYQENDYKLVLDDNGDRMIDETPNPKLIRTIPVKRHQMEHAQNCKFFLHRCNVEGGGILKSYRRGIVDHEPLSNISFEWLDKAYPKDVTANYWKISCPICRQKNDYNDLLTSETTATSKEVTTTSTTTEEDCPVCLEHTECQFLPKCQHVLCGTCFASCKKKFNGEAFFDAEAFVNTFVVPAKDRRRCRQSYANFPERLTEEVLVHRIAPTARDGNLENMKQFRTFLDAAPMMIWCHPLFCLSFFEELGSHALQVVYYTLLSLRGTIKYKLYHKAALLSLRAADKKDVPSIFSCRSKANNRPNSMLTDLEDPDVYFNVKMSFIVHVIADKCKEANEHYYAIQWMKKVFQYHTGRDGAREKSHVLYLVALLQFDAGQYTSSKMHLEESLRLCPGHLEAAETLEDLDELSENWIGTTRQLAPGLDRVSHSSDVKAELANLEYERSIRNDSKTVVASSLARGRKRGAGPKITGLDDNETTDAQEENATVPGGCKRKGKAGPNNDNPATAASDSSARGTRTSKRRAGLKTTGLED